MRRRTFLKGLTHTMVLPFALGGMRFRAMAAPRGVGGPLAGDNNRVLVLVQMEGGNDGLNTVVPFEDDGYYRARPTIGIPKHDVARLYGNDLLGLHPALAGLAGLYNQERLAIVTNIGYENYSLSHFSGTEIWNTASGTEPGETEGSGWIGRYLQGEFPRYPAELPPDPPAIQIRPATSSAFNGTSGPIGVALTDPVAFHELVHREPRVEDAASTTSAVLAAQEWEFVRAIETQAIDFSQTIRTAALRAGNAVEYPAGNPLAEALAIVARLIAGGLQTRVYMVNIGNFDTHGNQLDHHAALLRQLDGALTAFDADLRALAIDHRVVGMTFSEFGRRVAENGNGSDHGAAAPHMVFGTPVAGGAVYGGLPDIGNPDANGNLRHDITFQCYYASVLGPMFGITDDGLRQILPYGMCDAANRHPLLRQQYVATPEQPVRALSAQPNPANDHADIIFTLSRSTVVRLALYDADGRLAIELPAQALAAGPHNIPLDLRGLPQGAYHCRLATEWFTGSAGIVVRR